MPRTHLIRWPQTIIASNRASPVHRMRPRYVSAARRRRMLCAGVIAHIAAVSSGRCFTSIKTISFPRRAIMSISARPVLRPVVYRDSKILNPCNRTSMRAQNSAIKPVRYVFMIIYAPCALRTFLLKTRMVLRGNFHGLAEHFSPRLMRICLGRPNPVTHNMPSSSGRMDCWWSAICLPPN